MIDSLLNQQEKILNVLKQMEAKGWLRLVLRCDDNPLSKREQSATVAAPCLQSPWLHGLHTCELQFEFWLIHRSLHPDMPQVPSSSHRTFGKRVLLGCLRVSFCLGGESPGNTSKMGGTSRNEWLLGGSPYVTPQNAR